MINKLGLIFLLLPLYDNVLLAETLSEPNIRPNCVVLKEEEGYKYKENYKIIMYVQNECSTPFDLYIDYKYWGNDVYDNPCSGVTEGVFVDNVPSNDTLYLSWETYECFSMEKAVIISHKTKQK